MWNARLDESQAGIKIARRNINNLIYADGEEELKNLLMRVKEESQKAGLNSTLKKLRSWHPVPSLHGEYMGDKTEIVADFIFLGSKITEDGDLSHEIKWCLVLGRKAVTNLDSVLKSRHIPLFTKVHLVKAMVFPVVMYGCESWTIKKAKRWRIGAFECSIGEDSWESLGLQGDPTNQS